MDYKHTHDKIIERAQKRILPLDQYREKHHIIPRCLGGSDEPDNLVELTAREHYVVHQLLVKMYPNENGLVWAARYMTYDSNGERVNNRLYEWLKIKAAEVNSKESKKRWKNKEYRDNIINKSSEGNKRRWKDPEYRKKMSKIKKEKWKCSEYRKKVTEANKEYWSNPTKRKQYSESRKGKNNPSYGKHWYHHPDTLHNVMCKPDEMPEGYIKGKWVEKQPSVYCKICNKELANLKATYCKEHQYQPQKLATEELFEEFLNSDHKTLTSFATEKGFSQPNITARFKKHIPNYREILNNR